MNPVEQIKKMKKQLILCALGLSVVASAHAATYSVELLANGGFESGLDSWVNQGMGASAGFYPTAGGSSPLSSSPIPGPTGGSGYAVSDTLFAPGGHSLSQTFSIPSGALSATLKYNYFVNNDFGFPVNGGLNPDTGGDPFAPGGEQYATQHARIDIMDGSDPWGTSPHEQLWLGGSASGGLWVSETLDLLAMGLSLDTVYSIRFAAAENMTFLTMGVDDVSVEVVLERIEEPGGEPVPEVQTYASLFGAALVGVEMLRRRRKA